MKKLIRPLNKVVAQAMYLEPAKVRAEALGKRFQDHLILCIVYKDTTHSYNHWINDEMSNWLNQINDIELKLNNKKFKPEQLDEYILGNLGDARTDAYAAISKFQEDNRDAMQKPDVKIYPDFEIEEWMVTNLFSATDEFRHWICRIFSQFNIENRDTITRHCHEILDKYVL